MRIKILFIDIIYMKKRTRTYLVDNENKDIDQGVRQSHVTGPGL